MTFYNLKVLDCQQETEDAVVITFEISPELEDTFSFKPGQYLTLSTTINGQEIRRSYSICSAQHEKTVSVLVKRVKDGVMSNYLNDEIKAGDELAVLQPEGRFVLVPDHEKSKTYYFFAAGSGITPILSMISSTLEDEPMSTCFLLYGSRNEISILMREQIDAMKQRYSGQLIVSYILSQPEKEKKTGIGGLFKKSSFTWKGPVGRISVKNISLFLDEYHTNKEATYFICGPGKMIEEVSGILLGRGIDKKQIKKEFFTNADSAESSPATITDGVKKVTVELEGKETILSIDDNKTILEAMIAEGVEPPYSCSSGACATCIAKVKNGSVEMDSCFALDDDEIEEGLILTCQAHPTSAEVSLTYDV